ncbi:MAG: FTR1 family protein [Candidatus Dormibacteraeota bacterium]|nr:FTR1 family protein [Candidatus Dormibacteraeota bacterium]
MLPATVAADPNLFVAAVNPAVVVIREGIEAVLILAALTASFAGAPARRLRAALWAGVGIAVVGTLATWAAAGALLTSLRFLGQALDALVSLLSVLILLVITNWFFHRVYWTGWVAGFHARKRRWLNAEKGQLVGMVVLGFTSTYREGFESVLFLHTLGLQQPGASVAVGTLAGVLGVVAVGALVLVVMVGNTTVAMQRVGWAQVHALPLAPPRWMGLWLGIHGTAEGLVSQFLAGIVVFGSYWLAERRHQGGVAYRRAWTRLALAGGLALAAGLGWAGSSLAEQAGQHAPASFSVNIASAVNDPRVLLLPDCPAYCGADGPPGGALDFNIPNPRGVAVQVLSIEPGGFGCSDTYGHIVFCPVLFTSDRNVDGATATLPETGSCGAFAHFRAPNVMTWPTIPSHGRLAITGADAYELGMHMIHLDSGTPAGCRGATYRIKLNVVVQDAPLPKSPPQPITRPSAPPVALSS